MVMTPSLVSFCVVSAFLLMHSIAAISNIISFYCDAFLLYWKGQCEQQGSMDGY